MSPLEAGEGACLNHYVGEIVEPKGKPLKLRHYDISRAHFQGTAQRLIYIRLPAADRQKYGGRQSWQIDQERVMELKMLPIFGTELGTLNLT